MNISNSINQLKRTASDLCRGKRVYDASNWLNSTEKVVCIGSSADLFTESNAIEIDLPVTSQYDGKTLIVYGKNVVLHNSMPQSNTYSLNLFIDRGNLLLDENGTAPNNTFDKDGNLNGAILANYIR